MQRMPLALDELLTTLAEMGVQFELIVHQNNVYGDESQCTLEEEEYLMSKGIPIRRKIFSPHMENTAGDLEIWSETVRKQYETALKGLNVHHITLPPSWRDIVHSKDASYMLKDWLSGNCTDTMSQVEARVAEEACIGIVFIVVTLSGIKTFRHQVTAVSVRPGRV